MKNSYFNLNLRNEQILAVYFVSLLWPIFVFVHCRVFEREETDVGPTPHAAPQGKIQHSETQFLLAFFIKNGLIRSVGNRSGLTETR